MAGQSPLLDHWHENSNLVSPTQALPCPTADDRRVWAIGQGSVDQVTVQDLVNRADGDFGKPWPQPLASTWTRLFLDGDRTEHEELVFARQERLSRAVIAAAATLDDRYLDQVADGVWSICEQSSWCWPAHDDAHARSGWTLPDVTQPFIDLGAGEIVAQLSWIDQLLGSQLDRRYAGLRERIRVEARNRIFTPFLERDDWHWLGKNGDVHNWNPWILGNITVAALRLLDGADEEARRLRIIDQCIVGLDRYIESIPPDGAIDEGYHYWWNGACRALEILDILRFATNGTVDGLAISPQLQATVEFPHQMRLGADWVFNFADGPARENPEVPWDALHRAARQIGATNALAYAASHRKQGSPVARESSGLGRLIRALTDPIWGSATPGESQLKPVWMESLQVRIIRGDGLILAVKGGHNDEHHNHNDVGEVVVASDGVPVLIDAGRPTYTAETFGPNRYKLWMMQSAWHNVPLIRGVQQGVGSTYRTRTVVPLHDGMQFELAGAYPLTELHSWIRTARLTENKILLEDVWKLDPWLSTDAEPATVSQFLVAGKLQLSPGQALIFPLDGARAVRMTWPEDVHCVTEVLELTDPMLSSIWGKSVVRIALDVTGRTNLCVVMEQVNND